MSNLAKPEKYHVSMIREILIRSIPRRVRGKSVCIYMPGTITSRKEKRRLSRAKVVRAAPSPDAKRVPCEQHLADLCGKSRSDDSSRLHRRRLRQPKVPGETPETLYVTLYDRNSFSFHFHVFLFFARRQEK